MKTRYMLMNEPVVGDETIEGKDYICLGFTDRYTNEAFVILMTMEDLITLGDGMRAAAAYYLKQRRNWAKSG